MSNQDSHSFREIVFQDIFSNEMYVRHAPLCGSLIKKTCSLWLYLRYNIIYYIPTLEVMCQRN